MKLGFDEVYGINSVHTVQKHFTVGPFIRTASANQFR